MAKVIYLSAKVKWWIAKVKILPTWLQRYFNRTKVDAVFKGMIMTLVYILPGRYDLIRAQ